MSVNQALKQQGLVEEPQAKGSYGRELREEPYISMDWWHHLQQIHGLQRFLLTCSWSSIGKWSFGELESQQSTLISFTRALAWLLILELLLHSQCNYSIVFHPPNCSLVFTNAAAILQCRVQVQYTNAQGAAPAPTEMDGGLQWLLTKDGRDSLTITALTHMHPPQKSH